MKHKFLLLTAADGELYQKGEDPKLPTLLARIDVYGDATVRLESPLLAPEVDLRKGELQVGLIGEAGERG